VHRQLTLASLIYTRTFAGHQFSASLQRYCISEPSCSSNVSHRFLVLLWALVTEHCVIC